MRWLLVVVLSGFLIGCGDPWEIREDSSGNLVRIHKKTGVVELLATAIPQQASASSFAPTPAPEPMQPTSTTHDPAPARYSELEPVEVVPSTAKRTASGIASVVLRDGNGVTRPAANDYVTVLYSGWTSDGTLFDSSNKYSSDETGTPATFPLDQVIPGWTEAVQLMVTGEKRRVWIPAQLAYGENPTGGRPAGMLVFDIELLSFSPESSRRAERDRWTITDEDYADRTSRGASPHTSSNWSPPPTPAPTPLPGWFGTLDYARDLLDRKVDLDQRYAAMCTGYREVVTETTREATVKDDYNRVRARGEGSETETTRVRRSEEADCLQLNGEIEKNQDQLRTLIKQARREALDSGVLPGHYRDALRARGLPHF